MSGSSYYSQNDLRLHFGLGKATRAETIEVQWLSGQRQVFHDVSAGKFYLIEEGRDQLDLQRIVRHSSPAHTEKRSGSKASKKES